MTLEEAIKICEAVDEVGDFADGKKVVGVLQEAFPQFLWVYTTTTGCLVTLPKKKSGWETDYWEEGRS